MKRIKDFLGISSKTQPQFMSWIGTIVVCSLIFYISYMAGQLSIFLSRGKITPEIYERMNTSYKMDLFYLASLIITFYFGKKVGENNIEKQSQITDVH